MHVHMHGEGTMELGPRGIQVPVESGTFSGRAGDQTGRPPTEHPTHSVHECTRKKLLLQQQAGIRNDSDCVKSCWYIQLLGSTMAASRSHVLKVSVRGLLEQGCAGATKYACLPN